MFKALALGFLVLAFVACSQIPKNQDPLIHSFSADPASGVAPLSTTFKWDISDPDDIRVGGGNVAIDTLTCKLDVNNDGKPEYTVQPCTSSKTQGHTYTSPGTYVAKLIVEDGKGGRAERIFSVTANSTPPTNQDPAIASFTATPSGLTGVFGWQISDPDGDTLTCKLDVNNDGTVDYTLSGCDSSKSQNHLYASAGTYTAKLTVEDGKGGKAEKTATITVTNPPPTNQNPTIASFAATPNGGSAPLDVSFGWGIADPNNDPLTCKLDVDNNGTTDYSVSNCTSSSKQPHKYPNPGTYTAKLTVEDGKGGSASQTTTVTVSAPNNPPVINSFTANISTVAADNKRKANFAWNVSDPDGNSMTCTVDYGDGKSSGAISSCTSSSSASNTYPPFVNTYTAKLTVNDGKGGQVEKTTTVSIVPQTLTYDFSLSFKNNGSPITFSNTLSLTLQTNQGGVQTYTGSFLYGSGADAVTYTGTLTIGGTTYTLKITAPDVTVDGTGTRDSSGKVTGTFTGTGVDAGTGTWSATPK
ncbi:MAG TPA: PKD domain-containing protein [Meiothermus sp.]|nr:PKD domain-containing protein [Meiothermus sp.]